ncbi:hypothetical protein [Psychrobacter sp. I-STPA6b]|uniref:hypothetical protein n=1 Tax=Psychrobacter sp. I-STPA6b TaxID=2585718 RepID=UPI001D0C6400|nr:hypothetical protein [Psychrobacter sp. I-STPA6b]
MALKRVEISMSGKDAMLLAAVIQDRLDSGLDKRYPEKAEKLEEIKSELFNQAQGK